MTISPKNLMTVVVLICLAALAFWAYSFFRQNIGTINVPPTGTEEPSATAGTSASPKPQTSLPGFSLPPGFAINIFADGLSDARVMEFDPAGRLLVSQPSEGKISAVSDTDGDGRADKIVTVLSGLRVPHGMAFRCTDSISPDICEFYVAENNAVSAYDYDSRNLKATNRRELLDLPSGSTGTHFTRTLLFLPHPDETTLLISVGSSCNVCREKDEGRASVLYFDVKTGLHGVYARGLRNSVFMALHPVNGAVWATEMGRDGLGDDLPPDEINIIQKDKNYGWPNCYGQNIHDDAFDKNTYIRNPCMEPFEMPSKIDLQAHSAPLGLSFVPEEGWLEQYWHNLIVAYHGSWNRSVPTGYKLVRIKLDAKGNYSGIEDFITGWLRSDGTKVGRPVDVKVLPGGVMYISDDGAGRIYRVSRR